MLHCFSGRRLADGHQTEGWTEGSLSGELHTPPLTTQQPHAEFFVTIVLVLLTHMLD